MGEYDPQAMYRQVAMMRKVDEALVKAWHDGIVPGEYHSGIGEEGVIAGILANLTEQDTLAVDHRGTATLVGRGTDIEALMLECLGSTSGMNSGRAGHMHLMDPRAKVACDGIVGSEGPLAMGAAIAHQQLRVRGGSSAVAIAIHGDGAVNQGMLMESYSMAVAWNLPVVFVCKDNKWSITTWTKEVTGGTPVQRARGFGLNVEEVSGAYPRDVQEAAGRLIRRARDGGGPGFLHCSIHRPGGHFEGDPIVRLLQHPARQVQELAPGLLRGLSARTGGQPKERASGVAALSGRVARATHDWAGKAAWDPVRTARREITPDLAERIDAEIAAVVGAADRAARRAVAGRPVFGTQATTTQESTR